MKYVKIDNFRTNAESPFFSFPDLKDREVLITDQSFPYDDFFVELAKRLSVRHKLSKTATNLLKVFLREFIESESDKLQEGERFLTREIAQKAGYKYPSSVYQGLSDLCIANLIALKQEDGIGDGSIVVFPNPEVFGRKRCFVGEQLSIK